VHCLPIVHAATSVIVGISASQVLDWAERWVAARQMHEDSTKGARPFLMTVFLTATHYPYSASIYHSDRDQGLKGFSWQLGYIWESESRERVRNAMTRRYVV
jgi:hypothetical protein